MFDATVNFGTTEVLCKNLAECGIILGPVLGDYDSAYKFNILAFSLIEKFKSDRSKSSTFFIYATFISHWKKHFSEGLKYYDLSINYGMITGDIIHVSWSTFYKLDHLFSTGINLDEYKLKLNKAEEFMISHKTMLIIPFIMMIKHVVNQFQSSYNQACENIILENVSKANNMTAAFKFGQFNVMINYILGNYETALKWVGYTEHYLQAATGLFGIADYEMFSSLCYIKECEKRTEDKNVLLEKINSKLKNLKVWSDNCPENFEHKYYIVAAELARIQNDSLENITNLYKKSLDSIAPAEFINIKAVINEIIAEFWFSRNENTIGNAFIREAVYFYDLWGAYIKVDSLEKKYSGFTNKINHLNSLSQKIQSIETDSTKKTSIHSSILDLDLMSILKSAQAISNEIKVEKLLKVLMDVIIENTGAQKGCVLLKNVNDGEFYVEAVKNDGADDIILTGSLPLSESSHFCSEIVQYVKRTHEIIVVSNAMENSFYRNYDYIKRISAKSILCVPIIYQNDLNGIIYLENNLVKNAFDCQRIEIIQILSSQIAISVEKAQLYEKMEEKVNERTRQLALANSKLKELSLHDPLTKLYNRRYVYEHINKLSDSFTKAKLEAFFNRQSRDMSINNNVIGIFLLDIDHFKQVNDTYGHAAGDEVLIQLSNVLKSLIRSDDYIIRWGGEEFLILLNETKIKYLETFSEKILNKVEKTNIELPNKTIINKTCSIGCAYLPFEMRYSDLLTFEQTVNICDFALYKAKEHGRNCSVHVTLSKSEYENDLELKKYLSSLTKDSPVNKDFINIKYIKSQKPD
jgi:diguanylate cyclase (GGDEF)-like protein